MAHVEARVDVVWKAKEKKEYLSFLIIKDFYRLFVKK